ncbi:ADP-ribosylation [Stereum hirsutum FP-91666 SS1]|uniref:ADP-ribosylation n=1 Tax=Stereum hirsutum (strain FP-91666) TaxID=721885 RepID=UPI0004449FEE|nr:ADP-ribosylation [Stereum hirsutum FP-91666 SS1]EIM82320.1 ADP-ribosylation [Stereum hirsutum FP-91666 SS1]
MQPNLCNYCGLRPKFDDGTQTLDFCGRSCADKAKVALNNSAPITAPTQPNDLCVECGQRPKFKDSVKAHDYCSKGCAAKASATTSTTSGTTAAATLPGNLCTVCNQRPKFKEGAKVHEYCSKACAEKAKATNNAPAASGMCKMCKTKPVHSDGSKTFAFCGKACATKACKFCKEKPKHFDSNSGTTLDYCGKNCAQKDRQVNGSTAGTISPGIAELAAGDPRYHSVAHQFEVSWRHASPCPPVNKVYQIMGTASSIDAYKKYRKSLEDSGKFKSKSMSEGNEERRWHGTKRTCFLGDPGHTQLCTDASCSLCNIIRNSYDLSHVGAAHGWGRFGRGLYTSSTSSKSDNPYTKNAGGAVASPYKAMLLNKVAVGRGYKTRIDMPTTTSPPAGYDSVLGETGITLNYDELVVYRSEAIIPTYLVIYG